MQDHVRVHTGERPFACDKCDKKFANQSGLQKHGVIHSEERPYVCDICGFAFKLKRQLVKHYHRHLTPGSIVCPICGKRYYSHSELRHHMPTHTGERKFECNICNKLFMTVSSLGRHKDLHYGARFECHICGNLSMRKEYWRKHMIKVHQYDENDELLAKKSRFPRLYQQTEEMKVPSVHTIRVVKAESLEGEEGEIIQAGVVAEVQEIEAGQEISSELQPKKARIPQLYQQTGEVKVPTVHTIRMVKAESSEVGEGEIIEAEHVTEVQEIEPGQEIDNENVQYIISLDY